METYIKDFEIMIGKVLEAISNIETENENQDEIKYYLIDEIYEFLEDNKSELENLKNIKVKGKR